MKVTHKVKVNKIPKLIETLRSMEGRQVEIGALQGENRWLAGIHEFGCTIPVTPKMRAFLHHQGLHLKDSTTVITIPERSFLRAGYDENEQRIARQTERALSRVLDGKMSVDKMLDAYGEQFAAAIKLYMRNLSEPPNHPYTIDQKGSSNPLIDTGGLLESITWRKI